MAQTSKKYIDHNTQERTYQMFREFFKGASRSNKIDGVLDEFFTKTEKIYMTKRLMIMYFLTKGIDYDTIAHVLKVSTSTAYLVSQRLKAEDSMLWKQMNEFFAKEEWKKGIGELLDSLLPKDPRFVDARQHSLEHINN